MSTLLKSDIYVVRCNLLVECSKALRYRKSTEHSVIGGLCSVITELLFATYFIDNIENDDTVYSDQAVVSKHIDEDFVDTARTVIMYRNKFAHAFGTEEYYTLYYEVISSMNDIMRMCHMLGGMPNAEERANIMEYLNLDQDTFYDGVLQAFMTYGPIGYTRLVSKLKKSSVRRCLEVAKGG